ncbi:hypothetical protein [Saccharopolyspora erythraea]|uniref:hypothetical protein n=1 Tax=Saccharopolyspora erythraea TaxID=1836 RepID=UPI00117B337E|nr:hypothetical protein [Saccharopolyspora erythraea]QRK90804.1 hypothetical protein JQX30_04835 [Saccharopolyspora erythraea]
MDNGNSHTSPRPVGRTVGKIIAQVAAWVFIALGLVVWYSILTTTLSGYEGFGVEQQIVVFAIGLYGVLAGVGVVILFGVFGTKRVLPKAALAVYVLLLVGVLISATVNAEPPPS